MSDQQTCDAERNPTTIALVMVCLPSGGYLTYCRHHANKYRAAIEAIGGTLYDLDSAEPQATDLFPN